MVGFNYARSAQTAQRLIAKFGQDATLKQISAGADPWAPAPTETTTTITVVDLDREVRDASGTLTGQSKRTLYVSTSADVTPTKGDKVVIGGVEHEIDSVRTLAPGGTTVLWETDLAD
ncbi:MAG: hypothetical protein ACU0CF_04675 [Sagittula sp.]|uniref:hypothetical protein n=1 Tax=Sagittula sp. TaxID=2038081 RepID=UPI0040592F3D